MVDHATDIIATLSTAFEKMRPLRSRVEVQLLAMTGELFQLS
jgi:hypothetical protein